VKFIFHHPTENSDDDCVDVARKLVDEGEDVHHVK
jgi:hypothetical protein